MWASLRNRSHYSLTQSSSKPIKIAERAAQSNMSAVALTDYNSLAGAVPFIKALSGVCECGHHQESHGDICYGANKTCQCVKFLKKSIKPILGLDLNLGQSTVTLLAKNKQGWNQLVKILSEANAPDYYDDEVGANLPLSRLRDFIDGNLITLSGYLGSEIGNTLMGSGRVYKAHSYQEARNSINKERLDNAIRLTEQYKDIFGKDNFALSTQLMNQENVAAELLATKAMRYIAQKTNTPIIATAPSAYSSLDEYDDHRLLLCTLLKTNYDLIDRAIDSYKRYDLLPYFRSTQYYIPGHEEITNHYPDDEIKTSIGLADQCESYSIFGNPLLPSFGDNPDKTLEKLCYRGWKQKIEGRIALEKRSEYRDRIKKELQVIKEAGLSSYFLIVQDYCQEARKDGDMVEARGSATGCLLSYLIDITDTDPIPYDLSFERFYNAGRNTKERKSYPDIDIDLPIYSREKRIASIRKRWGGNKVSQIATFSGIKGRQALKEVFRIKYPNVSEDEVNKISKLITEESRIADELQEMKEAGEEPSILMWALENTPKPLREYCYLDEQGELQGEYAPVFRQAVRLEGIKKNQGKHAAGIIISAVPLTNIIPMIHDKTTGKQIAGMEMNPLKDLGILKFDILGVAIHDKLMAVRNLLEFGHMGLGDD